MSFFNFSTKLLQTPFVPQITIRQHEPSGAYQITAEGPHLLLATFVGDYKKRFAQLFEYIPAGLEHEFRDMAEIFKDPKARENFGNQKPQTDEEVLNRINFNAKRALDGNPFTGFAAIEKTANKIIGFVSLGQGYEAGESQSALILNSHYTSKGYAMEIIALASAIALVYAQNAYEVGPSDEKLAVSRFTATVLDSNHKGKKFLKKLGMKIIRPLTERESSEPRTLYGVSVKELDRLVETKLGIQEINYDHILIKP